MFKPLSLYIGLRYTRAKRRNGFISFISLASMLGIALGVTVLITVLSVFNGFNYQIRHKFFELIPQVTVMTADKIENTWPQLAKNIQRISPDVIGYAPFNTGTGMVSYGGQVKGIAVMGIQPKQEKTITELPSKMVQGSFDSLKPKSFNMLIGADMAQDMGLQVGDKITLFTPVATTSLIGIIPRYKRFTISGIFKAGPGIGYDNGLGLINFSDGERLFPGNAGTSGLHLKLADQYLAPMVSMQLQNALPPGFVVNDWTTSLGAFFHALAMEKTMMFIILILIIAVAAFNLVSSLVMIVNDKQADIAILRTLGARPRTIMMTFIVQGALVGIIGTLLGLIGGIILALNATSLVSHMQHIFGVQFVQSSVFFLDYLPSRLELGDVLRIGGLAFAMALLATIYPAWRAFRTQPAEALRYE